MSDLSSATADAQSQTRLGWVLGLTSTAYFMVVIDAVVVITALPRMQRDLKVSLSSLQWTLNAYGIAFAAGALMPTRCRISAMSCSLVFVAPVRASAGYAACWLPVLCAVSMYRVRR